MKRLLNIIAMLVMIIAVVGAIRVDVKASDAVSQIESVDIVTTQVSKVQGANIELKVKVRDSDNDVGISRIMVEFSCVVKNHKMNFERDFTFEGTLNAGEHKLVTLLADENELNPCMKYPGDGTYIISRLYIVDNQDNVNEYNPQEDNTYFYDGDNSYIKSPTNHEDKCYVVDGKKLSVGTGTPKIPTVEGISFINKNANKGERLQIKLTNPSVPIGFARMVMAPQNSKHSTIMLDSEVVKNNVITFNIPNNQVYADEYYIEYIDLYDENGNYAELWTSESSGYGAIPGGKVGLVNHAYTNQYTYITNGQLFTILPSDDEDGPVIKKVRIENDTVFRPGIVKIHLDYYEPSGLGYVQIRFDNCDGSGRFFDIVEYEPEQGENGTTVILGGIPSNIYTGDYYLSGVYVDDKKGNISNYNAPLDINNLPLKNNTKLVNAYDETDICQIDGSDKLEVKDEFDIAMNLNISNSSLASKLANMAEGKAAKILITSSKHIAKKEVFEAIKGKDKTIIFYRDNYQWVFNGKDITSPKDIDLEISFDVERPTDYGSSDEALKITFPNNGTLPGRANVRIKSDYTASIYKLTHNYYLYYINKDESLDLQTNSESKYILDDTDSWCKFYITHNSSYMLSGKKLNTVSKNSNTTSKEKKGKTFDVKSAKYKIVKVASKNKSGTVSFIKAPSAKKVKVPKTVKYLGKTYKVTAIEKNAFKNNKKLVNVELPAGITSIGASAFYSCKKLKSITIGESVSSIGKMAFKDCKELKKVTIKTKKLTEKKVGSKAFSGINSKAVIKVPKAKLKSYKKFLVKKGLNGKKQKITK